MDMQFGMGIPTSTNECESIYLIGFSSCTNNSVCPEHEHYQHRTGLDPLLSRVTPQTKVQHPISNRQSSPTTSATESANSTPEKPIYKESSAAIPLPRPSQKQVGKRDALSTVDMNSRKKAAQASLNAVAAASGVPAKQILGMGLSRFTRDVEDEAMREGSRRKMF